MPLHHCSTNIRGKQPYSHTEQLKFAQNEQNSAGAVRNSTGAFTSVIGKLQVVVMEGKEVFDGRDPARTRGELSDTVVFAGQDLHVVICQEKREKLV